MKYLIVGLGNPGDKYKNNRHNVGFMFADYLIQNQKSKIKNQKHNSKFKNNLSSIFYHLSSNILLAKPQTFMNLSGSAVKRLSKVYGLKSNNLIVVHDDLDIPLGKFKIQKAVGPRLHNGIESIEKTLGTKDFWRVRIGVDNRQPDAWIDGESYVLQDFTSEEKKVVEQTFPKIDERLKITFDL